LAKAAYRLNYFAREDSSMSIEQHRKPTYNIDPSFVSRWSSRALTGENVPDEVLWQVFEAARWAPSGANAQPWRFIYAKRGDAHWDQFVGFLAERNQAWAKNASALILVLSRTVRDSDSGPVPSPFHSFDAGAAWLALALQASQIGWSTRAVAGFDRDRTRTALGVPAEYALEVFVALGKRADPSVLPESIRGSEKPTDRLPISALVASGQFSFA